MASSYNTFPSLSLSPPPCAPSFSPRHTEQGHAPSNPSPNTSYLAYQCTYVSNDYKLESVTSSDKVGLVSTHPNSPLCPSPFSSLFYSSPTSPQPSLYQVPPSSCSTVNGPQSNMSKHGISPTSPTTSPSLPYGSFSFSSRNCRLASNHPNEVNGRTAIGTNFGTRKPSSHYVSSRSNKADILLDRKAFISLEKSINWQSMLNDASPLASSSSTHRTSPFSRYCSTNQPSDQCTLLTGQAKDNVTSSRVPNMFSSPQLSPVTSPFSDTSQCRSFQGNCSLDANLSLSTAEREFTLPGMKDVPSWLKLLRLHKYAPFFSRMSYEEMLELTEDVLENRNITKGARQKLILSIQKLKARSAVLLTSEQELVDFDRGEYRYGVSYSSLSQVLFQIRAFLSTPIRPSASNGGESSPKLVSPGSYSSVSCSSLYSLCSSPSSSVSLSPPFLTSNPVDVNNNHGSYNSGSNRLADPKELFHCWSSLTNTDLSDIITRLIGHMHHILVGKCKKRLKKLKLWQEYFKDIFDKLSVVNTEMNLQEREVYERYSLDNSSEQVNNDSDREENDEDEDSGLLDFESGVTAVQEMSSPSLTPNGTDKDSGVDEANCDSDNCSLDSDILTLEEEEELYMVMRSVLDKCLSHEAFWSHQVLYMHWREQLQCMINALRYIMNDSAAVLRTCSPIAPKAYSTEYCFLPGRYSSKSSVHQSQCPPVNGLTKHKLSTFQSCKKSPNSNYPKTSPSPNYSASMSAGRRLLHNRLRSTINHGTISNSSTHLNSLTLGSNSDEKGMRANLERRNLCLKSPSKLDSGAPQPGPLYSNLSVIPQLSNLFSSPITLNFHPNTAFAGNSPEANLRNLLLQQLLTTQQQQPQAQAQAPISGETSHSKGNSSSQSSPVSGTIDYNSAARSVPLSCTTLGLATPIKSPSTIDSCQFNSDMATSCASKCNQSTGDETHRPIESTNHPLDLQNGASLWSLNDPLDNMDAKKLDWNATDLLSSLDYCNNGGKIEDMLSLLDNNLDMIDWPNNCPTTMAETITFDDIEQLCIRMAEHALDINDDSIYS